MSMHTRDVDPLSLLLAITRCACADLLGKHRPCAWRDPQLEPDRASAREWLHDYAAPLLSRLGARGPAELAARAAEGDPEAAAELWALLVQRATTATAAGGESDSGGGGRECNGAERTAEQLADRWARQRDSLGVAGQENWACRG